jgi:4-alpha-glucanotransferase
VDASGVSHTVSPETMRAVLGALALPCGSVRQIVESLAWLEASGQQPPPLRVVRAASRVKTPRSEKYLRLVRDDGEKQDLACSDGWMRAPDRPGYYRTEDGQRLAVVPAKAYPVGAQKIWGVAAQLYALRGGTSGAFGDFAALAEFADQAAGVGASAVAISPIHALFRAAPDRISPYAPSTRLFLNPLYANLDRSQPESAANLIEWKPAAARKWASLQQSFQAFRRRGTDAGFVEFVRAGGPRLLAHARFEVLDGRFRANGITDWRRWPEEFRASNGHAVRALAASDPAVMFELFLQWHAARDLAAAQARCRARGMDIGLIADMAVGTDPCGSHAWSAPSELLDGLSIGAPPDLINSYGQNWGLTSFSPLGLRDSGYQGFIETLRATMRHAGGIRLDHAMGLQRLWVIPNGGERGEGVYLTYPFSDLMGLLALESWRHRCIVIGEDLGTVPLGFRKHLSRAAIPGMRVLWFERDSQGGFQPPELWDEHGVALSSTHDLPTLAGWWKGRDIEWHRKLGGDAKTLRRQQRDRARERRKIWKTLKQAGCGAGPLPAPDAPDRFADAAITGLAVTRCPLALVPVEDFTGEAEQPNIPGTIDEHPNWRRRLKQKKPFAQGKAKRRAEILDRRCL